MSLDPERTRGVAGAMVTVLLAVAVVAAVGFLVDWLDWEHRPEGLALVALAVGGAALWAWRRLRGE